MPESVAQTLVLSFKQISPAKERNTMLHYQYEDARETKLWKKVIAVILAAVLVIGALVELLCQTSMVKNRLEVSAMMSGYTRDIVDTSKAASIDNPNSSHWYKFDIQTAVNA